MKRTLALLGLVLLVLLGCSPGRSPGSLQATILGLPSSAEASVSVTGAGFSKTLKASETLSNLNPGSYSVSGQAVLVGGVNYIPTLSASTLDVKSDQTSLLNVSYTPPPGSSSTVTITLASGGTVTLGAATLSIPPNAFVGGTTATVTLTNLGKPQSTDSGDPLKYVSDAYSVSATLTSSLSSVAPLRINPQSPPTLSIVPNGDALTDTQDLILGQRDPNQPNRVSLFLDQQAQADDKPVSSFRAVTTSYSQLEKIQWVVAVPKFQKPEEKEVLQVPWYHQSGIPWCAPTSLTAMLRYYSFNETVFDDAENAAYGNNVALANWQVAQLQNQDRDSGGGWPLDQVGLAGKYTIYLWDAAAFLPDPGAKGGFNDFKVYTILVNTGVFGLFERRPLVMIVDNWWHSVTVVGISGDGLYYHDSNGLIAYKTTWDQFQQDATGWKKDAQNKQILVQTLWTGVLGTGSGVAVRPENARRGSIVLLRSGVSLEKNGGGTASLEWDADSPHSHGYYFKDGSSTDNTDLGAVAKPGGSLAYSLRVANVTNVALPFSVEVTVANSSGSVVGSPTVTNVTAPARDWATTVVSGTLAVPNVGGSGMLVVKLKQAGVLQDVKYLRFYTPLFLP